MFMSLFSGLTGLLFFCRTVLPRKFAWHIKIFLFLLILLAAFSMSIVRLFGGPLFFAPDLPAWVQLPAVWLYACFLTAFLILLVLEIPRDAFLLYCRIRKKTAWRETWKNWEGRCHLGILILSGILTTWGMIASVVLLPEVCTVSVRIPNLPEKARGLRIVMLADLHADRITRAPKIAKITKRTNELKPDLIVIAGDFADGTPDPIGKELEPIAGLKAKHGVFGVPGNHEYYSGYVPWMAWLYNHNVRMLENECIPLPECGITVAGITDPAASGKHGECRPDLDAALRDAPTGLPVILLAHRPKGARKAADRGVALQLSGHTHGGMMPVMDLLVACFNGGYVSGLYDVRGMPLYVSDGTGIWNGFPVRIGKPAEITLIELQPE